MSASHYNHVGGADFSHHLGFQVAAIHGFQVRNNRMTGKGFTQAFDRAKALGEEQRSAGFEPVDAGFDGYASGVEGFIEVDEVE
jgi:hypothetical protein